MFMSCMPCTLTCTLYKAVKCLVRAYSSILAATADGSRAVVYLVHMLIEQNYSLPSGVDVMTCDKT